MITVETTPFGLPAMEALAAAVAAAKGDDPLRQVLVVVPTDRLGVAVRRGLARSGADGRHGIAGISPITMRRLAESIATPELSTQGRLPVTRPVLVGALRRLLTDEPGRFAEVADHPDTARALAAAHDDLRLLDATDARSVAETSGVTADVVRIHTAIAGRLAGTHYDEVDLLDRATAIVSRGAVEVPPIIVFLPDRPDPAQRRLIEVLARHGRVTVLIGATGASAADDEVRTAWQALSGEDIAGADVEPPLADVVLVATDADDEVREVVRRVIDALAAGTPGHRIGILYGSRDPYARLLAEHLAEAGVAVHGRGVRPASERMYGRSLRHTLALPHADFRRDEVMALLAEGAVQWRGSRAPSRRWERVSREAGVVRGDDWGTRLPALADKLRRRAAVDRTQPDAPAWAGNRDEGSAEAAEELAAFVTNLHERLAAVAASASWSEAGRHLEGVWREVLGSGSGGRLPEEERRVADSIDRIVRSLPSLDSLDAPYSLDALRELVETELDADLDRVGRSGLGVHVAPVRDGAGLALDLVFLVGLAEGLFPPRPADDPLLPDAARQRTRGELPTLRQRIDRQHRDFLAALASAPAGTADAPRRILSFPRGDLRRGGVRVPSRWLVPTLAALSGVPDIVATEWERAEAATAAISVSASYSAALLGTPTPGSEQEWRQRAHAAGAEPEPTEPERRSREMRGARRGLELTRFDGLVGPKPLLAERAAGVLSPTSFEAWFACPHRYLVQHVLGVREVEDPEEIIQISALDKGNVMHRALDRLLQEAHDAGEVPVAGAPWPPEARARLERIIDEEFAAEAASGRVGLMPLWETTSRGLREDLREFLARDDKRRVGHGLRPLASELEFGRRGNPPVEVPLGDGRVLQVRGSIDRVDEGPDGALAVVDYKTGKRDKYRSLSEEDPTDEGRFLQLALYAVAARQVLERPGAAVEVGYWFITRAQKFELVGYPVTDAVLQAAVAVLAVAVDGIHDGLFPPRPKEHSKGYGCAYCDPDGLGERTSVERFEALLSAPALAGYRDVVAAELTHEGLKGEGS